MKQLSIILAIIVAFGAAQPAEPATLEVRPPGGVGALGDVYTSIQQAIDDANAGDTINVAAGVYEDDTVGPDDHLVIDKANLTLRATDGNDSTTINVANGVGIDIRAGGSGFVLGGAAGHGFTIAGGADTSFVIQLTNAPSGVEISHNIIDTTGNASMGVSVGAAGAADLTISNNGFVADSGDGCVWGPRLVNLTVSDNTFDGGAYAIQTSGVTSSSPSVISGNVITSFDGSGGIVICNGEATSDLSITGNTITGCTSAIRFAEYCAQGSPGDMTTVTIEDNTLSTNDKGIRIGNGDHVLASNFTIQNNCISGNTSYGLQNEHATEVVTAEKNAWGDASGPYHSVTNTSGLGDEVSNNVDYYPWYLDCTLTTPAYKPVHNVTLDAYYDTIQGAIDEANPGDLIQADAGTYPEYLHITTDGLTIEGAGIDTSIIDLEGLTPYWHYPGCSSSFASRAGVYIVGYGSDDQVVEGVTFRGFTVKNAGLNPPITATGTHTGPNDVAILTDSSASWTPGELVGQWIHNYGDRDTDYNPARSYGQITANSETTVTATLSGGMENDWDVNDPYLITPYEEFHNSWWVHYPNYDWVRGLAIGNANDILIQNCKLTNNGYGGITTGYARCVSTHKYSENITIDNCIVTDHQRAGINIGSHAGAFAITNNTCERNKSPHYADATREYAGYGITVSGRSSSLMASGLIYNNTCNDNGFEGIIVDKYTDGVTVKENTVTGHNLDQDGAGIFLYHWGRPEYCKNHDVNDNTVTGNIRGIVAYYTSDSIIQNNTITTDSGTFAPGQGAIKLDGCNNVEVKNNTISCDGVGISMVYWEGYGEVSSYGNTCTGNTITGAKFAGIFISGEVHDNTFTDNTITGTTVLTRWAGQPYEETQGDGVFIDDDAGTGNVFYCNKIYGNADDGMENQVTTFVDAENNWWGDTSGPGGVGGGSGDEVSDYVDFFPWLLSEDCNDSTEVVADIVVDDDWASLPDYTQVFVDAVDYYISLNAFDDIQPAVDAADPCNMIYVQDGNYSPFTVDGKTNLTITSASTVTVQGVQSVATAYNNRDCVVFVKDSTNVVLQDLNIEGSGLGSINAKSYGVIYENSSGHIKDCNVSPNTIGDMSSNGIGIWDGSDVNVDPTLVHNFGRIGIFIYNGCNVEVLDSEIIGQVYSDGNLVNYGIEVEGAWGSDDPATASQVTIKRNMIYNCDNTDTEVKWGSSAILINGWLEYMAAADSTVTVVDNDIYDNYSAVYAIKSSNSRATLNNIYGNRTTGVESAPAYDGSTAVFDAEYNWWGDVSGPNDPCGTTETDGTSCPDVSAIKNADGLGDGVSENASYCAWLTAPACTSANPCLAGDLNFDGCVNWEDVAILADEWLEGCE